MFRCMMLSSSFSSWITHFISYMGSCFGCCTKSQPITHVDEPSKGLRIEGQVIKKQPSIVSDDFWSTSTCDMENSTAQSQRSLSSISVSNHSSISGPGSTSSQSDFVNHGLLLWNQTRLQWIGNSKSQSRGKVHEPVLSSYSSYESLLGTSKRFPQPVPLPEMIEFLVDIWDQEGMYG
ncbi:hypothetical protein ACJIZ3_024413 [Penstemon smallii]|uniref:Gag1-like clamp domain-containing protein n=1 Tax=Penstemon smallii TaxID=265156 RepID=A0ABD3TRR7_9LAMI